jgi:hypothetical protein
MVERKHPVNLHGPMYSLLQDRSPFMSAGFVYCGFRVQFGQGRFVVPILTLQVIGCRYYKHRLRVSREY